MCSTQKVRNEDVPEVSEGMEEDTLQSAADAATRMTVRSQQVSAGSTYGKRPE